MRHRILWLTLAGLLLSPAASFAQSTFPQVGHATTVNTSGARACFWYSAWDATDEINQVFIAGSQMTCVNTGETAEAWLAFDDARFCKMQTDWHKFPDGTTAPVGPTMGTLGNYFWDAPGKFYQGSRCAPPPITPPPPDQPKQCGPPLTFTFGGSPSIAKFEPDYPNKFLPEYLGPFYFYVPAGSRYRITSLTGDNHVGPGGKNDGPQNYEIGVFWFDNGTFVLPPTNDVPDDANSVLTDFGVHTLTASVQTFYFLHAGPPGPPERANSFYPISITFTCVD